MIGKLVSPIRSVGQSCQAGGNSAIRSVWMSALGQAAVERERADGDRQRRQADVRDEEAVDRAEHAAEQRA